MKHRLLLAIDLPPVTKSELLHLQEQLTAFGVNAQWKKPEKLIVDINYLGRIEDSQATEIKKRIRQATHDFGVMKFTPVYLQALYSRHEPTEIFLNLSGDIERLMELQKTLSKEFKDMDMPQPQRYDPQITLGTLPRIDPTTAKQQIDKVDNFDFSPLSLFEVDTLTLFELFVSKAGTHIQKVGAFVLESTQI